ncbi:hypothetical protein [Burkholderia sp. TSV86]|nr:hypothetical protein [Burkholderia sp. TSV86]
MPGKMLVAALAPPSAAYMTGVRAKHACSLAPETTSLWRDGFTPTRASLR